MFRRRALSPEGSIGTYNTLQLLVELYVGVGRYLEKYVSGE
jgi:hypothetical protein